MNLLNDKRGQVFDMEVLTSPMFILLAGGSVTALALGYYFGKSWGLDSFPLWQLIVMLLGCIVASYAFAARE